MFCLHLAWSGYRSRQGIFALTCAVVAVRASWFSLHLRLAEGRAGPLPPYIDAICNQNTSNKMTTLNLFRISGDGWICVRAKRKSHGTGFKSWSRGRGARAAHPSSSVLRAAGSSGGGIRDLAFVSIKPVKHGWKVRRDYVGVIAARHFDIFDLRSELLTHLDHYP